MDNRWRLKPRPSRVQEKLRQRRAVEDEYLNLLERYECLREEVEPRFRPDELQPVIDDRAQLAEMAILKIKMAEKNKEIAALDREVTIEELKIWPHSREFLERRMRLVSGRFLAAGEEVWTSERKRIGELHSNFFPICNLDFHDCMVALYRQPDAPGGEAMFGTSTTGETMVVPSDGWRADSDGGPMSLRPVAFRGGAESLRGSGNFLSLHREIEKWFGTYKLVILPNDPEETPIRRWKTAVISSQLNSERFAGRETLVSAFDSQELVFNGEERPVAEFAYFHFVMALVRAKMLNYEGWRDVWADFCGADLVIIDSWIRGNGFYEDEILRGREKDELARRILVGVEEAVVKTEDRAERIAPSDDSETESDGSEDSEDDSEADSSEGNSESDGSEDDSESDGSEDDSESDSSEEDSEADNSDDSETDNSEHGSETDNPEGGLETDDSEDHSGTESDSAEDYLMED
uniref:Uncharacterized protein n=1 Tax=Bionectria ochroleuca TaxID=29856 RepID=A0A8H7MZ86_BIOOC